MSKVVHVFRDREYGAIVETNDKKLHYVDACFTYDRGFELMSFPAKKEQEGYRVVSWSAEIEKIFSDEQSMTIGFETICEVLESYLES